MRLFVKQHKNISDLAHRWQTRWSLNTPNMNRNITHFKLQSATLCT